jgi:hypothetical protein
MSSTPPTVSKHQGALNNSPEQSAYASCDCHGSDTPESDACHGLADWRAAGAGPDRT